MFYPPFVGNLTDGALYFGTHRLWVSTNATAGNPTWTAPAAPSISRAARRSLAAMASPLRLFQRATIYTGSGGAA